MTFSKGKTCSDASTSRTRLAGADPRDRVMRRIAAEAKRFPEFNLEPLCTDDLDARSTRLAQAIYAETVRRWLSLRWLISLRLKKQPLQTLDGKLQAALLAGTCQLCFFDALPDHAVVNETVNWVREHMGRGGAGLVNAILHRMIDLRGPKAQDHTQDESPADCVDRMLSHLDRPAFLHSDGRLIQLAGLRELEPEAWPGREDEAACVALLTGHPHELIVKWMQRMSLQDAARLSAHNLIIAPAIVVGLSEEIIASHEHLKPHGAVKGFALWTGDHAGLVQLLASHPTARVQDPASFSAIAGAAQLLVGSGRKWSREDVIIDVCAGSGTKTAQIVETIPEAQVIATDIDQRRFDLLAQRFNSHKRVRIVTSERLIDFAGKARLILLDVPCSNTGTLARRLEARYRTDTRHMQQLLNTQRQILADSLRLRSADGWILYSTCSLEPEENNLMARWLCQWHRLKIVKEQGRMPQGFPGQAPDVYSDGGYYALIR